MEVIVADQIIMGLILDAGDAKQHIYQVYQLKMESFITLEVMNKLSWRTSRC